MFGFCLQRITTCVKSQNTICRPISSMLTNCIEITPKNFERELWNIYDTIEQHPWISKDHMIDLRQKIFDSKNFKKSLNPILKQQTDLTKRIGAMEKKDPLNPSLKDLKKDLKSVTDSATPLVENLKQLHKEIFDEILLFPNCRPSSATSHQEQVLISVGEKLEFPFPVKSHADFSDILFRPDIGPPSSHFLLGQAALTEFAIIDFFESFLLDSGFRLFGSMPDLVKGCVIVGCGSDPRDVTDRGDRGDVIPVLPFDRPHSSDDDDDEASAWKPPTFLVGGSSLYAFAAFFTKMLFRTGRANTGIPMNLFAIGKHYKPLDLSTRPSLFNVTQSNRISTFGVPHHDHVDEIFEEHSQLLTSCYLDLGLPFKLVEVGKQNLSRCESRRHDIQVWSPKEMTYHTCASVSHHNDYIGNRLLTNTRRANTYVSQFVSGVAVDVAVLLGAVIENGQAEDGTWTVPDVL